MTIETGGLIATLALLGALLYSMRNRRRKADAPGASARSIPPRRLTAEDVKRCFTPTGKTGEILFARSEDGSKQVTARWREMSGDGLIQLLVSFEHNKRTLLVSEDLQDHLTEKQPWTHKSENLQEVCATEMVREVQRGGPYLLRRLRDEWIAERRHEVRKEEPEEGSLIRFYLDGRRATYVRTAYLARRST